MNMLILLHRRLPDLFKEAEFMHKFSSEQNRIVPILDFQEPYFNAKLNEKLFVHKVDPIDFSDSKFHSQRLKFLNSSLEKLSSAHDTIVYIAKKEDIFFEFIKQICAFYFKKVEVYSSLEECNSQLSIF